MKTCHVIQGSTLAVLSIGSILFAFAAAAQVPGAVGQPLPRDQDLRPATEREAENYDPKGIQIGSFTLFPSIEADETFSDNIYATSAGKQAAFVQLFNPALDLRSDWNNHMLNLYARSTVSLFSVDPSLNNFQDVSVGGDGQLDIQRNWYLLGGASWNRQHEERGTPNTVTGPGLPITVYNQTSANIGYYQKFNRLSVRLDGRLDNFSYLENSLGPAQGVIPSSDRNRNEWREAARLGYEFLPGYEVWVRGSFNQRTYSQLDTFGLNRSSYGFDVVGGILIDLGAVTSVEVFAGYLQQNFVDNQFAMISTPTFGVTGY